jgi:AbrB family looped-hinge helix DNA binding protein
MSYATLTSKGQITVPLEVREALGIKQGDRLEFQATAPGRYEVVAATVPVTALKGLLAGVHSASLQDMEDAIAGGSSDLGE